MLGPRRVGPHGVHNTHNTTKLCTTARANHIRHLLRPIHCVLQFGAHPPAVLPSAHFLFFSSFQPSKNRIALGRFELETSSSSHGRDNHRDNTLCCAQFTLFLFVFFYIFVLFGPFFYDCFFISPFFFVFCFVFLIRKLIHPNLKSSQFFVNFSKNK